uniref:Uncharacterized protein n=1 Tax=Trieres chinensis TaxID=1514140 RepID=A0A7S2EF12_TRICV|mmetsp:Transcript_20905/g.42177  ORF Transcript_20905/g.42177 Transcript_20905/m.42177 type:complete len:242 (+) Transcript_20905:76-801(+)
MYSTKSIHKNINPNYQQTYTSIGDPYRNSVEELPSRWKKKQFVTPKCPKNAYNGLFVKPQYTPDPYTERAEQYSKTQPLEKRRLGFGSHDAFKPGEFTSDKATERYRNVVRQEQKLLDSVRDEMRERELIQKLRDRPRTTPKDKLGKDLKEPKFLYDVGRTHVTLYSPQSTRDSFYKLPKHAPVDPKLKGLDPIRRLGSHRPMSASIGEQAWRHKYAKPEFGQVKYIEKFYDRGHIECKGF